MGGKDVIMENEPAYEEIIREYSLEDLLDVKEHIERHKFPERYDLVLSEITKRRSEPEEEPGDRDHQHDDESKPPRIYSGFFIRLLAFHIDGLVLLPIFFMTPLGEPITLAKEFLILLPYSLICLLYSIYFHARWGQSVGKMVTRIKVVTPSGQSIGWKHAFWRDSPNVIFMVIYLGTRVFTLIAFPEFSLAELPQDDLVNFNDPVLIISIIQSSIIFAWFTVDSLTLLLNRKRRALHDFIAGTVVVYKSQVDSLKS